MELNPKRLGVAGGILWGVSLFVLTLLSVYTGYAAQWLSMLPSVYPGYAVSVGGSIVGLLYGFVDAFIGLFILAWLYNKLKI
jgi:hypothetical protein